MNFYSIIGFTMATTVLFVGFYLASEDMSVFLDYTSLFIVFGGTLAATSICFQLNKLLILVKVFFARVIKGKTVDYPTVIRELMGLAESYRGGKDVDGLASEAKDPFLKEGLQLFADGVLAADDVFRLMEDRIESIHSHYMDDANRVKTVSKFPPAFGMMGTTIGMIVLLGNLSGPDAADMIGPAMAVCLITTLYGVVVANLVVIPVAENLIVSSKEILLKNRMTIKGLELLMVKTNPIVMAEELNSFLPASLRLDWKEVAK